MSLKFDPKAYSTLENREEDCLEAVVRYGYTDLVTYFLSLHIFEEGRINQCLQVPRISKEIKKLLKSQFGGHSCCCNCF